MSSRNGGRSPKDLRHLLHVARQDETFFPEEVEANLAKLKMLSKDDLNEKSMLRDRIDQQSQLICILKRQADTSLNKLLALETEMKDLQLAKEEVECTYHDEKRKLSVLEKRFEILYHNHEEIIKIKDGYKAVNDELRRENEELVKRKKGHEMAIANEKNAEIECLKEELRKSKWLFEENQEQFRLLQEQFVEKGKKCSDLIADLESKVNDAEGRAQSSDDKKKSVSQQLLSSEKEIKNLKEENEKWVQMASGQRQTCSDQEKKIAELLAKVKDLELSLKRQGEKFARELEDASADAQVRRLKAALVKAEEKIRIHDKDFEAYKKHTEKLLSKERELNSKLRQLIG